MKEDVKRFLHRLESAFGLCVHDENAQLADALAYMNYLDSVSGKGHSEAALEALDAESVILLPVQAGRTQAGLCHPSEVEPAQSLFWVEDSKRFLEDRNPSSIDPMLMFDHLNDWLSEMERTLLWFSDLNGWKIGDPISSADVALGLGLYAKRFEGEMWIFSVQVGRLYKPTWVDAGFTFYWYAAPEVMDHGLTRDLHDGKPRFNEWVARKAGVRIVNWTPLSPPLKDQLVSNLGELRPPYVEQCRKHIGHRRDR
jgi:hypothetical protein